MQQQQMDFMEMLECQNEAEQLSQWNYASRALRTVFVGMIESFVTPYENGLTFNAERMINKSWNDLRPHEQDILTAHGITAD